MKKLLPILFLFISLGVQAIDTDYDKCIPTKPTKKSLVHDFAEVLSIGEERILDQKLIAFEQFESNEIVVITVRNTCDLEIEDYSNQLGRKWGIGKKGKQNGIIVIAAIDTRKIFIKTGDGLEGAVPDVIAKRIIRNKIVPFFKQGQYYNGFDKATDALMSASRGEFEKERTQDGGGLPVIFFFLLFFGLMFVFFFLIRNRKNIYVSRRGSRYDTSTWDNLPRSSGGWISGGWGNGGGFGGSSGGGFSGGGGFGGFGGGGGFSGGGAGGSW